MKPTIINARYVVRRLTLSIARFLKSSSGGRAKLLLAALFVLMLCINGMNVLNSYVGRYFMSAIERRDTPGFVHYAWLYAGVFGASTVVAVFFRFAEERLGLLWRDWLTRQCVTLYIDQNLYLQLQASGGLSNPDQRMSEDVKQLTTTTLSFLLLIVSATVTVLSFSGVLWTISPTLFIVAVLYAIVGSAVTFFLGRPLMKLNYRQSDFEADFRSQLIHLRDNADGIAVTRNQDNIRDRLMNRIEQLVANFRRITAVNRNLSFFTTGYNYMIQLIPTLLVAPLFMRHGVEFGVIGQSAMAFSTLLAAFSLIVTQFQTISAYASVTSRLGEFVDLIDQTVERDKSLCIQSTVVSDRVTYQGLTLRSIKDETEILLKELNASFVPGRRALVHGTNYAAQKALFRASAGIHEIGIGRLERPPPEKLLFLPEQPYLPSGTLRELLLQAGTENLKNEDISRLLVELGLEHTLKAHGGIESPHNWQEVLSFEEKQLMAVARALLAEPTFVFLDRLGSALGHDQEIKILQLMAARGITCVSFAERSPDPSCHDVCLELFDDGSWKWTELRA